MSSNQWKTYLIGDIGRIITGKTPSTKNPENFGNKYPFITPRDMLGQKKIWQTERYLSEVGKNEVRNCLLPANAVCISCIGSDMGKVVMTTQESVTNQQLNSIICDNGFDPNFVYYAMVNISIRLKNTAHHSTAVPILNKTDFSNFEFSSPGIDTQKSVAFILSALDDKIELNRQTNQTLESIAQAIYKEWFINFNFPGATGEMQDSELGPIPKGWRVVPLGEVTDLTWGDTNTTKKSYVDMGYPAFSASGRDGFLSYYDFDRDGIVVSAIGAYAGKTWFAVGKWSCIKNTIRFWSINPMISNEYLYLATSGPNFWPLRGSAQPFISQTDARGLKVLFPSGDIGKVFGEVSRSMFRQIEENDIQNRYLGQIRNILLPKLMNGEIEI